MSLLLNKNLQRTRRLLVHEYFWSLYSRKKQSCLKVYGITLVYDIIYGTNGKLTSIAGFLFLLWGGISENAK